MQPTHCSRFETRSCHLQPNVILTHLQDRLRKGVQTGCVFVHEDTRNAQKRAICLSKLYAVCRSQQVEEAVSNLVFQNLRKCYWESEPNKKKVKATYGFIDK